MCKSSIVSSWGYYTELPTALVGLWSSTEETDCSQTHSLQVIVHMSACRLADLWQVKISWFPHDGLVNYWTELVLLIHALVHTERISYLSNTSLNSHTWLQAASYPPRKCLCKKKKKKKQIEGGKFFFFVFFLAVPAAWADGFFFFFFCSLPQFISSGFEQWVLNVFVSFTDKTEDFIGTFSLLKCIMRLICSALSICYPNKWHWWWGWMIKLCYCLCYNFVPLWLADSGCCE